MMYSSRAYLFCSWLLLYVNVATSTTASTAVTVRYTTWLRASTLANMAALPCRKQLGVVSLAECAQRCSALEGCDAACFSRPAAVCYVIGMSSASDCVLLDDGSTECFEAPLCRASAGFSAHQGRCLKLGLASLNKDEAAADCSLYGTHLYYVKAESDRGPLITLMAERGHTHEQMWVVWVGGGDALVEGAYTWYDGTPLSNTSSLWTPSQPNNYDREDCLVYNQGGPGLNDRDCANRYLFVCEQDLQL